MYRLTFIIACIVAPVLCAVENEPEELKVFTYSGKVLDSHRKGVSGGDRP